MALNDLWFVGDAFINKNYYMLPKLKHKAVSARRKPPYIFDQFNISCFSPNQQSLVNVLARMVNCVIKALNDALKLPWMIIFVPDADILAFIKKSVDPDNTENIDIFLDAAMLWIVNQVARAIEAAKDNLSCRKPGAVVPYEPKLVWVKMMNRLNGKSSILKMINIFNECLENCIAGRSGYFIIDLDQAMDDSNFFDLENKLNSYGCSHFWNELDKVIEKFEKREVSLKPFGRKFPFSRRPSQAPRRHSIHFNPNFFRRQKKKTWNRSRRQDRRRSPDHY